MVNCRNRQRCLHFRLLLEDLFEQLSGIVKNVDRHGKTALFLIMTDRYLRIIQAKTKAVHHRKSVNNATISYTYEWDGIHHGLYHLYGHLHDRMAAVKGRALNVGWDMHGRFLTAQDIDGFLRDLPAVQYFDDKQNVIVGNSTEDAAAKVRARLAALNE